MNRESWKTRPVGPGDVPPVIARAVRRLRERAGMTQDQLASEMHLLGFAWNRVTVARIENAARRVDVPELLALAAILRTPIADFVAPRSSSLVDHVEYVEDVGVKPDTLRELVVGRDGEADLGGDWPAADELRAAWQREG